MTTVTLILHCDHPRDRAIRVSQEGDDAKAFWLPRSKIAVAQTGKFFQSRIGAPKLAVVEVELPEWLATKEGLI